MAAKPELTPVTPYCSIERALVLLSDRWSFLVMREILLYEESRFGTLQEHLGIASNVLTERLNRLVEHEILERVPYSEHPERFEYRLTEKGAGLRVALLALMQWGDRHLAETPPRIARRVSDGSLVSAALVAADGSILDPGEVETVAAAGAQPARS